jgi:hypothetical protein
MELLAHPEPVGQSLPDGEAELVTQIGCPGQNVQVGL